MYKAKVLVLGPCQSGKTIISNFLSDATETSGGEYHPTQGCRILEFEATNVNVSGRYVNAEIELWDCSGDHRFEACWPAIAKDSNGVIFVFNPEMANHDKDLEAWFSYFVEQQTLKDTQCLVLAHHKSGVGSGDPGLPSMLSNIKCVHSNIDEDGDNLRDDFNRFLGDLLTAISDKREQEELSIMNS